MPDDRKPPRIRLVADAAADQARVESQRQRIPTIVDGSRPPGVPSPEAGGSLRFDPLSLDRPAVERRLSPASMRRLGTVVGDLAEALGGSLASPPQFATEYHPDGTVTIVLTLRANLAAFNEHAAEHDSKPTR